MTRPRFGAAPFFRDGGDDGHDWTFSVSWLEFDADGGLVDAGAPAAIETMLNAPGDRRRRRRCRTAGRTPRADATKLYGTLWGNAAAALDSKDPRKSRIVGIVWPAKQFSTDFDDAAAARARRDKASRPATAPLPGPQRGRVRSEAQGGQRTSSGRDADAVVAAAREAATDITFKTADALFQSVSRRGRRAAGRSRTCSRTRVLHADRQPRSRAHSAASKRRRSRPRPNRPGQRPRGRDRRSVQRPARRGRARPQPAHLLRDEGARRKSSARRSEGACPPPALPAGKRLHLVGHSFGARLVTAAANALPAHPPFELFSLTLLQGAFSHNGLSAYASGAFANVLGRPTGPIPSPTPTTTAPARSGTRSPHASRTT